MTCTLYAGGHMKGPLHILCQDYLRRMGAFKLCVKEVEGKAWRSIVKKPKAFWVMWGEEGQQFTSSELWAKLNTLPSQNLCFFIGEAPGIPPCISAQGDEVWSLGAMTWPHLWARAMVLEQLYRWQAAQKSHPYSFI